MGSGRILGAGAVLVALVVLGARPAGGEETKGELSPTPWGRIPRVAAGGEVGWGGGDPRPWHRHAGCGHPQRLPRPLPWKPGSRGFWGGLMELRGCCPHPGALLRPGFFQFMPVFECHYLNGTKRVKYLQRVIYNRQQNVHFDSDVGHFVADTELGKPDADYWNSLPGKLEDERASVDTYCQCNYKANEDFILNRRAPPSPPRLW
uniref:MHC class II beta chain N-terminal domain-containing protein n=1 Tax=Cairina moschata TaxID=8855 RepID=A0A8C3CIU7_CAIMO